MTWVRLDDRFFDNPKVKRAGRDARDFYLAALCWSAEVLSDGIVSVDDLGHLANQAGVKSPRKLAARLVEVGLWTEVDNGYLIHDWQRYNPSADEVQRRREEGRQRAKRSRERTVHVPANEQRTFAARAPVVHPAVRSHPITPVVKSSSKNLVNARADLTDDDDEKDDQNGLLSADFSPQSGIEGEAPTPTSPARTAALARLEARERDVGPVGNRDAWLRSAEAQIVTSGDYSTPESSGGAAAAWARVSTEMSADPNPRRIFDDRTEAALEAAGGFGPLKSGMTAVEAHKRFVAAWIAVGS